MCCCIALRYVAMPSAPLRVLTAGQLVPFGGDRVTEVDAELAASFREGDRLVVVHDTGDLLHVPHAEHAVVGAAVGAAVDAFGKLADVTDEQLSGFFAGFAARLADDATFAPVAAANAEDMAAALARGRSTTRLELTSKMRAGMIDGLQVWQRTEARRDAVIAEVVHDGWSVRTRRAPLGVVGFVFEGRPNVFADATGVLRTGNTVVFRIGSDALGTARAIMASAVRPALAEAGIADGAVQLIDSAAHAAGWALFADRRLGLAVARGSGRAVAQLGAVARQHGVPVSLHGTGGAWMMVAADADQQVLHQAVLHSLDRKVCNTLNVCCVERSAAAHLVPAVVGAAAEAAAARGAVAVLHLDDEAAAHTAETIHAADTGPTVVPLTRDDLGVEWEWEDDPELSIVVVGDIAEAASLFDRWSPRFAASLVSSDAAAHERFYRLFDAPFVGNGFTRWVDGQFAFDQPELGLSNWQAGRLFGRGGVLSGDSVFTVRTVATVTDHSVHR